MNKHTDLLYHLRFCPLPDNSLNFLYEHEATTALIIIDAKNHRDPVLDLSHLPEEVDICLLWPANLHSFVAAIKIKIRAKNSTAFSICLPAPGTWMKTNIYTLIEKCNHAYTIEESQPVSISTSCYSDTPLLNPWYHVQKITWKTYRKTVKLLGNPYRFIADSRVSRLAKKNNK